MSVFSNVRMPCPACAKLLNFKVVHSLNADRRPDFRDEVIAGKFQREQCPHCSKVFRLEPEMNYLDVGRSQWIAAFPVAQLATWTDAEQRAKDSFEEAFGADAGEAAREVGAGLSQRVVFGWPALREKLVLREHELDDITMELLKILMVRGMESSPLANDTELRFLNVKGRTFEMAWIRAAEDSLVELLEVPQDLYHSIIAAPKDWSVLRERVCAGSFVDSQRLMAAKPQPKE